MVLKLFRLPAIAAIAAIATVFAAPGASEARDWLRAMERHDQASDAQRYVPKGGNPQWDFDLRTVMNDMKWRARTAAMLRNLPRPGDERRNADSDQLADRSKERGLQFRF